MFILWPLKQLGTFPESIWVPVAKPGDEIMTHYDHLNIFYCNVQIGGHFTDSLENVMGL